MNTFLTLIIALGIGFGAAWAVLPETRVTRMVTNDTDGRNPLENPALLTNKFFEFADTFTANREMGTPVVLLFKPELDMIAFRYGTSQESSQFGVYNYATNELFTGLGNDNYITNQHIVTILDNDRILVWTSPGVDALATDKPKLEIINFTNAVVGTIPLPTTIPTHFHQAYNFNDQTGKGFITVKNTFDHTATTKYEDYEIDTKNLMITRVQVKG